MEGIAQEIERYWHDLALTATSMHARLITRAVELLLDCYRHDATVFVVGNGGSAATASHFACDLGKGTQGNGRRPFRVVPLTDNVPLVTAWANDVSYDHIFAEQLRPLIRAGDTLVVISASGNSPNVIEAARLARKSGATVIAFTGQPGGRVQRLAHLMIRVPCDQIEIVEDAHLAVAHSICCALRACLADERSGDTGAREPVLVNMAI